MNIEKPPRMLSKIILEEGEKIPFEPLSTTEIRFNMTTSSQDLNEYVSKDAPKDANAYYLKHKQKQKLFDLLCRDVRADVSFYKLPETYFKE